MRALIAGLLVSVSLGMGLGCEADRVPTAAVPQAANQRERTSEERIDHLIVMLKLPDSEKKNVRAARLLGESGPEAQKAIPALEEATQHPSPEVQQAARDALAKIRGAAGGK